MVSFASGLAPEPYFKDEWAELAAAEWMLNSDYGFYPPNRTWGAPLLASPLNDTHPGPWLAHTTGAGEAIEGLFRHHVAGAGINLTLEHIGAMQRDFGYTCIRRLGIEMAACGRPVGDQWYLWGVPVGVVLPLERLVGVTYSKVDSVLTVCDNLPLGWKSATVKVPLGCGSWASVTVERLLKADESETETKSAVTEKRITVTGNTMKTLKLQPWMDGKKLKKKSATPPGYQPGAPRGHVGWTFEGESAKDAVVTLELE